MDRQAWRDFFITVFLLGIAFVIAILSSIAAQQGEIRLGAVTAAVSLLLAVVGAIYILPRLARRVQLEFIRFAIRTSVTIEGLFFVILLVVIGFAAWNTANNLLYLILSAMIAFLFAANLISRLTLGELSIQLRFPDHIFAGEPANISVAVTNHKGVIPAFSLMVEPLSETDGLISRKASIANGNKQSSGSGERTVVTHNDESGHGHRGRERSGQKRDRRREGSSNDSRGLGKLAHFVIIPPRSTATQRIEYRFQKRGAFPITSFKISTKFPTGFFKKWRKIDATGEILVYPKPRPLDDFYQSLPMLTGQISSNSRGLGDDLYVIRRYQPTDHIRYIDWKATAKSSVLMVRDHTRQDERRLTIVFDTSRPSARSIESIGTEEHTVRGRENSDDEWFEKKFEQAVVMAASLANHFILEGAEVELLTPYEEDQVESGKGPGHLYKILQVLATLTPDPKEEDSEKGFESGVWGRRRSRNESGPQGQNAALGKYASSQRKGGRKKNRQQGSESSTYYRNRSLLGVLGDVPVLSDERRFKVFITPASKGSIPSNIWRSAHVVFMDDLKDDVAGAQSDNKVL